MMDQLPTQIGRYQVLGLLGTGGMAEVLLARLVGPGGFEHPVVIKRILPHLAREQEFVNMFLDEARIVAGIRHPNVVQVHELGETESELFLVMEYLEGESVAGLARRLSSRRKLLSFGLVAHILAEVCAGLHAAHELKDPAGQPINLVHRDVSPANVFVTYSGQVNILDFGIAVFADRDSRTEAGLVKGKYAYMSPEQCRGRKLDRRSDIFSLGTVLYELSTCRRLFKRQSDMLTFEAICTEDPPSPTILVEDYPPELEHVCMKALSRDPRDRYATALEMRRDLLAVAQRLNEGKIPEESLSRVMQKLFVDRVEKKAEMLRKIRAGLEVTQVPAADTDVAIDLPEAARDTLDVSASIASESLAVASNRSHRWPLFAAIAVLGVAAVIAVSRAGSQANELRPTPVILAPSPPPEAPVPPEVALSIETQPAGAGVFVAGKRLGTTPAVLQLARSTDPVTLEISLDGYQSAEEQVVPDAQQKLKLTLARIRTKAAPRVRRAKSKVRPRRKPKVPVAAPKPAPPPPKPEEPADPYERFN